MQQGSTGAVPLGTSHGTSSIRGLRNAAKRAIDITLSAVVLLLLSPLFAVIYACVRLDSPGPGLFRQERIGKDGKPFTCLKFRSMRTDADPETHRQAISRMASGGTMSDDDETPFKLMNDPRITGVGKILRQTSLDELPQFINVLRGDMSLVGPRPAIAYELEHYADWYHQRYSVKPGITGVWQIYGRGRVGFEEMMRLDVEYAASWSILTDLKLCALTIPAVLGRRGAR